MKTFFPLVYSTMSIFSGGKPESNSTAGSFAPGSIAENAEALVATKATASPDKTFIFVCRNCGYDGSNISRILTTRHSTSVQTYRKDLRTMIL